MTPFRPSVLITAIWLLASSFVFADQPNTQSSQPSKAEPAHKKYLLQYKFQMGEVLRYGVKHSVDMRSTIEGTTQRAESKSESIKAWKVTDVLPSGEMEFVHVVEHVRMSNRLPSKTVTRYDSKLDKTPPPGFEQAARAVGVPISVIRLAPDGEIVHREEKTQQQKYSPDRPITLRLPSEPIAVGEKWTDSYDIQVQRKSGIRLKIQTRRLCKLLKVQTGIATLSIQYQILTPVDANIESQLIDRLTRGTVRFDIARGRVISQTMDVDKRVLGFAGNTSSMHYVSRLEERLLKPGERLARK